MAAWTWRKWADPVVDFGHELYYAWRISQGDVLYRDMQTPGGALAYLWNGLLYSLFGVGWTVLIWNSLVMVFLMACACFAIFRLAGKGRAAMTAGPVFLVLLAFSQYQPLGGYNYMGPYFYANPYGVFLGVLAIAAAGLALCRNKPSWWFAAGMMAGAGFLCKLEPCVALIAGLAVMLGLAWRLSGRRKFLRSLGLLAAGFAVLPVCVYFYFLIAAGPAIAWRGVAAALIPLSHPEIAANPFYANVRGTDLPMQNILRMLGSAFCIVLLSGIILVADYLAARVRKSYAGRRSTAFVEIAFGFVLSAIPLALLWHRVPWGKTWYGLPALVLCQLALYGWRATKGSRESIVMCGWLVFSFVMLAKIVLNVQLADYGFALAAPAVLAVCVEVAGLGALAHRNWNGGRVATGMALGCLMIMLVYHLGWTEHYYRQKIYKVGSGPDVILSPPPNIAPMSLHTNLAVEWINTHLPATALIAPIPESTMINYLSRRKSPVQYASLDFLWLDLYGRENVERQIINSGADAVVWATHNWSGYGVPCYGTTEDTGLAVRQWVDANFHQAFLSGDISDCRSGYGIAVFIRNR
jgi:hypothetical protein